MTEVGSVSLQERRLCYKCKDAEAVNSFRVEACDYCFLNTYIKNHVKRHLSPFLNDTIAIVIDNPSCLSALRLVWLHSSRYRIKLLLSTFEFVTFPEELEFRKIETVTFATQICQEKKIGVVVRLDDMHKRASEILAGIFTGNLPKPVEIPEVYPLGELLPEEISAGSRLAENSGLFSVEPSINQEVDPVEKIFLEFFRTTSSVGASRNVLSAYSRVMDFNKK